MENQLGRGHRVPTRTGGHYGTCQAQDKMQLGHRMALDRVQAQVRTSHPSFTFLIGLRFPQVLTHSVSQESEADITAGTIFKATTHFHRSGCTLPYL